MSVGRSANKAEGMQGASRGRSGMLNLPPTAQRISTPRCESLIGFTLQSPGNDNCGGSAYSQALRLRHCRGSRLNGSTWQSLRSARARAARSSDIGTATFMALSSAMAPEQCRMHVPQVTQ
jgi:hypothetical protein